MLCFTPSRFRYAQVYHRVRICPANNRSGRYGACITQYRAKYVSLRRPAPVGRTGDIPAIQSVAQVAFPATYAGIISPAQTDYMMEWMYSTASLLRQMTDEGHVYYVGREEDGTPVGYVSVQREGEDRFHLQKIYVLPDRQGRQIGRMLFGEALRAVKESHPGPCTLELNVNRSNRARGFYEKMGMRVVREGDFPIGEGYYMNDYIMGMEL